MTNLSSPKIAIFSLSDNSVQNIEKLQAISDFDGILSTDLQEIITDSFNADRLFDIILILSDHSQIQQADSILKEIKQDDILSSIPVIIASSDQTVLELISLNLVDAKLWLDQDLSFTKRAFYCVS
ncbi:MAG: hypothetical protein R3A13_11140 [Bdellovibrionota bacterium]